MIKLILVFGITLFHVSVSSPIRFRYGIIIDAGSSSSKLHLYRWIPKTDIKQVPKFEDVLYKKFRPGVAAFYPNLEEIEEYVMDMLRTLENDVMPEEETSKTRISFLATAGLRFLPEEETLAVLNKVRSVLGNKTLNPFLYDDKDVTVLSGEEESVFSWMTVNYLKGTFYSSKDELESEGMIEIGGGSVQIAYATEVPVYDGKVSVRVGNQLYDVYTHSFLSYGSGSIATRIQRHLLRENPHATGLINPCMLRDDKIPALMRNKLIKIYGEGNASECARIVKQYLKAVPEEQCSPKPCTIGGVYGPPIPSMNFVALGNIHATTTELGVLNRTGELDLHTLESRAAYFCGLNLTEARNEFNVTERWASSDCQNGVYIPMLLRALGFHDDVKIFAKKYINNVKVGWTLGAILHHVENSYMTRCIDDKDMC
ncbi:hypothetical protein FSP39_001291 [Pinctada imbricata]|uniref:Uncharacterized protein n=1 Tax=Pinctada imbricata TaxID=66713 RepID=A0AA89BYI3_PINIB|nr:hypothetical protein FSP39_001291 [Pinctada imbricata]